MFGYIRSVPELASCPIKYAQGLLSFVYIYVVFVGASRGSMTSLWEFTSYMYPYSSELFSLWSIMIVWLHQCQWGKRELAALLDHNIFCMHTCNSVNDTSKALSILFWLWFFCCFCTYRFTDIPSYFTGSFIFRSPDYHCSNRDVFGSIK